MQRIKRESSLSNFIEQIASQLLSIPGDLRNVVAAIVDFILSIIRRIRLTFLTWVDNIESVFGNLLNNTQNSNQRRRRSTVSNGLSDLLNDLPNLLQLPVNYFQQATSSLGDSVVGQIVYMAKVITRMLWNFITKQLLPWLDDVLKKLRQTNVLPSFLNEAIGDANSVYSLLRLFSEITSKSS